MRGSVFESLVRFVISDEGKRWDAGSRGERRINPALLRVTDVAIARAGVAEEENR